MNWIVYSGIMFVSSIGYYLIVKKVQELEIGKKVYMIANYTFPVFLFLLLTLANGNSLKMSLMGFVLAILTSIVFNYVGTIAGYIGVKKAPNAGYSVIIQKSYALYTSFASVILFNSELPAYKLIGVFIIIIFTAFIILEKKGKKFTVGKWFWYSLLAFILFGGILLTSKYAVEIGENPNTFMFWVMLFTLTTSVFDLFRNKKDESINLNMKKVFLLASMTIAVSVFYWSKNMSTITAPNVGYTSAINASSNAGLTVVSAILYKEDLKLSKIIGVIGVVVGLVILIW